MRMRYPTLPWVRFDTDPEIKDFLLRHGTIKEYKKNEVIIPPFYEYPYLSLIAGGVLAKGFTVQDKNKQFSHSIIFPGSTIGTYYFMTKNITNMKIIAIRASKLVGVPHETVYSQMSKDSNFMRKIINHATMDLISDSEGLATVSSRPAEEKYKILVKILLIRFHVKAEGEWYKIPIKLTHTEISRIIYTTPLTVNRIIIKYLNLGLIRRDKGDRYVHKSLFDGIYDWNPNDPLIQLG